MTTPLTATAKRQAIAAARDGLLWAPHFFHHPEQRLFAYQVLDEALARLHIPLVFRALSGDPDADRRGEPRGARFEIGRVGDTRVVHTKLRGAFFAWLAIDDRGRSDTVRAGDLAAPWAVAPDNSARKAIRTEVANWLEAEGFIELAAEVRTIQVAGGVIKYRPTAGAPRIETQ